MFKKILAITIFALFCVFLQATIFGTFFPRWMIPNLCLVIVVFIAVHEVNVLGAILAFLVGILFDLSSGQMLGPWSGAFVAIFGLMAMGGRQIFLDSWVAVSGVTFIASIVAQTIYLFLLSQFKFSFSELFSGTMYGTAFITAVLAPPFFSLLKSAIQSRTSGSGGRYKPNRMY